MSKQRQSSRQSRRQLVEQQKRRRNLIIGTAIAIIVLAVVGLVVVRNAGTAVEGVADLGAQERGHDEGVVIEAASLPPVGGVHSPRWQTCGIYDEPVDTKNAVHSMEHGAVWITYHPDLPQTDIDRLQDLVRGQTYVLLSPYPDLQSDVVLTAWGIQLEVDSADDGRIEQFIDRYRLGPQTPEFGASCDNGVGIPIG